MKKQILALLMIIGICSVTNAQVCKISNTTNDNVEVFSAYIENNNTVIVKIGNDSQEISANVTVTVEVTYQKNTKKDYTFTGKCLATPNKESTIRIPIPEKDDTGRTPTSVKVKEITGTKCQ